jgi:glutathione S-transferase
LQLIICEFFEDAFPQQGTRLLPSDPFQRAAIRFFIDQWGQVSWFTRPLALTNTAQVGSPLYALLRNQDRNKDEELRQQVHPSLPTIHLCSALEQIVAKFQPLLQLLKAQSEGPFFLGNELSLADIAVLPFIDRFSVVLKHYRDFDLLALDERLPKWLAAAHERDAFRETARDSNFYIEGYRSYAQP